jgi:hypothetical protein
MTTTAQGHNGEGRLGRPPSAGDRRDAPAARGQRVQIELSPEWALRADIGLRGCCASYWLADPTTGKVVAVAMYTTEKELRASADTVAAWKEELIPQAGGKVVSVDEYEVIAEDPGRG